MTTKKLIGCALLLGCFITSSFAKHSIDFNLEGLNGSPLENAKARLANFQKFLPKRLSASKSRQVLEKGKKQILKAIAPYGFFRAKVSAHLEKKSDQWIAHYRVISGEPLRISALQITIRGEGENEESFKKYLDTQPLKKNDACDIETYNKVKTKLFTIGKNHGYLKENFQNKILIDLEKYTCVISISLDTGSQSYFGETRFATFPYSKNFMQRFIEIKPGDVFSSKRLIQLQQDMEKSYYFQSAVLKPDFKQSAQDQIPLTAYLTPPKAQKYTMGIGYGTLTGARLSSSMSLRHLGNEGHHLESELKLSSVISGISTTYYIPGKNPLRDLWHVGARYKHFAPDAGISNSLTFNGGYSKKFDTWENTFNLSYLIERFQIYPLRTRIASLLYPSWKLSWIKADSIVRPHNAYSANFSIQGAIQQLFSTTRFLQPRASTKIFFTPGSFSRFILRGDVGYTMVHNLTVFPLSMRYFAGGVTSIRGFRDSSIGPGKYLAIGSLEYQQHIKGDLYAAIFYDAGIAANTFHTPLSRGAGLGLVYDTVAGPLKIYAARAISKRGHPFSLEFSIGPEFS